MTRTRLAATFVVLAVLAALPACGGSSGSPAAPPPTPPPTAVFSASASPNPIIAEPCTPEICGTSRNQYRATVTVTVTESGGVGGNVNFINTTLRNATTGVELATLNYSANDIISRSGTNHVNARSSLAIPRVGIIYTLAGGGRQGTLTLAVSITDDRGAAHNQVLTVPVV